MVKYRIEIKIKLNFLKQNSKKSNFLKLIDHLITHMKKESRENCPLELLDLVLKENVQYHGYDYFEDIFLIQNSIPTISYDEIDLSTEFLGKKLSYPIVFASMIGGNEKLADLNGKLAEFANKYDVAMGVGDQIYGILRPKSVISYSTVREEFPKGLIFGNLGASDLLDSTFTADQLQQCIDMIAADAMEIYINPLEQLFWNQNASKSGRKSSKNYMI